ncbi:MAG TPA: type II secretion system protein, partial [Pirellulales bacterium]|nr:type II secretion system protein [Pirellulales bacterium]
ERLGEGSSFPLQRSNRKSKIQNPKSRSAFTLVELLMVIAIIGMLTALVSVAAVKAIAAGRNAQITTEIGLLDSAMQTYKNDTGGAYPPDTSLISTAVARQNRILSHLRKAFPRLIVAAGYGPATTAGTLQYMSQQAYAQSQSSYTTLGSNQVQFKNTKTPNGVSTWGDFDNMDPAEALVFWLGGFALPYQDVQGRWTYKLIGFGANKVGNAASAGPYANGPNSGFGPFILDDISARDPGPFEFYQGRLGDADGDGWPEYYPPVGDVPQPVGSLKAVANPVPPYVYFDAISYGSLTSPMTTYPASAAYPSASGSGVQPTGYAQWGTAIPYVQSVPSSGTMTWVEPQGFQIICAGLDQMYWFSPTPAQLPLNMRVFPAGTNYSEGDMDNLTCFTTSTLQSALK